MQRVAASELIILWDVQFHLKVNRCTRQQLAGPTVFNSKINK